MNITDYIVAFLKTGHNVELPGIGTLATTTVAAHYDASQATMYPSRQETTFSGATTGDNGIVEYIARQDCVSQATAQQMWKNYLDALKAKLQKESEHTLEGVGTLEWRNGAYSFQAAMPEASPSAAMPIAGVKRYNVSAKDPFAQFEQRPAQATEPAAQPTPMPAPEPETATAEPKAAETEATEPRHETAEPEPTASETEADPDPILTEPIAMLEEEDVETPAPSATPEPMAIDATPETEDMGAGDALKALDEMPPLPKQTNAKQRDKAKKKGKKGWLVALILLLLCLMAAAAYYYIKIYKPAHTPEKGTVTLNTEEMVSGSQGSETHAMAQAATEEQGINAEQEATEPSEAARGAFKANNDFTFSTDMLKYDDGDISRLGNESVDKLQGYIANYVKSRRSGKALEPMMQRVRAYATQRLGELLGGNAFHVQDLLNYCANDYQHAYLEKDLRQRHAARQQIILQRDLMNPDRLGELLDEVMRDNNLAADAAKATATPQRPKQGNYTAPPAAAQESTKKGFDVIAGFYVNKGSADKLANTLKKKGCDAYIINRDGLYYVSMGSASSQTAAEAMYHHIKEWYKGDVAIKKW